MKVTVIHVAYISNSHGHYSPTVGHGVSEHRSSPRARTQRARIGWHNGSIAVGARQGGALVNLQQCGISFRYPHIT